MKAESALDEDRLRSFLMGGPKPAAALIAQLGVSQPTFSRLIGRSPQRWVVAGRSRATLYASRRQISGVESDLPLFEVDKAGQTRRLGTVIPVEPRGFYVAPAVPDAPEGFFEDLPYFLNEFRPAGFLGRLIPRRHPDLPPSISLWSGDDCVAYAARFGWNLPGALILGDAAFALYMRFAAHPPDVVARADRSHRYPATADAVLSDGPPGSSAGGEQPKFLSWTCNDAGESIAVLVKFSSAIHEPVGRRVADLLIAEHVAHQVLTEAGYAAAESEILEAGGRIFLQVKRFDRVGRLGRLGVLPLSALDDEFVGHRNSWSDTARQLVAQSRLAPDVLMQIRGLELFGQLIANTDMHLGNLSVFMRGRQILGLTPTYDMLPMHYTPRQGDLKAPPFVPPLPKASDGPLWSKTCATAVTFWNRVARRPDVSAGFRKTAAANAAVVEQQRMFGALLPV